MKRNLSLCLALAALASSLGTVGSSIADDAAVAAAPLKNRIKYRDERPDDSRGWMVVSKESYWPLCYESMDRLEEARKLIGQAKPEELADALNKCGAWLKLASSAAMTDQSGHIYETISLCNSAADDIRSGSNAWKDESLKKLIVLGDLAMARSHSSRAEAADEEGIPRHVFVASTVGDAIQSKEVKQAKADAAKINQKLLVEQFRYETVESKKHLEIALAYLNAAVEAGGEKIDPAVTAKLPELAGGMKSEALIDFNNVELRARTAKIRSFVDAECKKLIAELE